MKRAIKLGDAWHPNLFPMDKFSMLVTQFRGLSPEAKTKEICVRVAVNTKAAETEYIGATGEKRIMFSGNMRENRNLLRELEKLGVSEIVLVPSPEGKIPTQDQIQSIRSFASEFLI